MDIFEKWLSSCHSSIKARFVECMTNSCPVDRFSHLSCGSLQLLQSYHGPLGSSLMNALLARPVSLGGRPCLGRFAVVPYTPYSDDRLNSAP